MPKYPQPEDVTSPRGHWTLIKVLYKGDPEGYSIALGKWDDEPCLAMRWNACEWRPVGNPQSRGLPTWFIIPPDLARPILDTLDAKTLDAQTRAFAQSFLPHA